MATLKVYTIVFRDSGAPKTGLSPTIDACYDVSTGTPIVSVPSVSALGSGIYKFSIDWSSATYNDIDDIAIRVDSNDIAMSDSDRYIYGTATRVDDTDHYTLLDAQVLGNWIVSSNQLKIYSSEGVLIKTFDLTDINDQPTNTAATSRIGT
jgi:hypothetical protein